MDPDPWQEGMKAVLFLLLLGLAYLFGPHRKPPGGPPTAR